MPRFIEKPDRTDRVADAPLRMRERVLVAVILAIVVVAMQASWRYASG
jgi:hypothetical protein